jgi:hypothetical protein
LANLGELGREGGLLDRKELNIIEREADGLQRRRGVVNGLFHGLGLGRDLRRGRADELVDRRLEVNHRLGQIRRILGVVDFG